MKSEKSCKNSFRATNYIPKVTSGKLILLTNDTKIQQYGEYENHHLNFTFITLKTIFNYEKSDFNFFIDTANLNKTKVSYSGKNMEDVSKNDTMSFRIFRNYNNDMVIEIIKQIKIENTFLSELKINKIVS